MSSPIQKLAEKDKSSLKFLNNHFYEIKKWSFLLLIIVSVLYCIGFYFFNPWVTTCKYTPYSRILNPDVIGTAYVGLKERDFLAFTLIRLFLALLTWQIYDSAGRDRTIFWLLCALFVSYFPAMFGLEYIKMQMSDRECGSLKEPNKGNGISGHWFYISWALLVIVYLNQLLARFHSTFRKEKKLMDLSLLKSLVSLFRGWWIVICSACFLLLQGVMTYRYGYHSFQQIYFGIVLGIAWALISLNVLERLIINIYFKIKSRKHLTRQQFNDLVSS